MIAWLPALKALLPYVTQIAAATIPAFTTKKDKNNSEDIVKQQILELQDAVTHNSESVKLLASQLQQAIKDIDSASNQLANTLITIRRIAIFAIIFSLIAIIISVILWSGIA